MTRIDTSVRRRLVKPPSARTELANVLGVGSLIVVAVLALLAFDSAHFQQDDISHRNLLPFQSMVQDRPSNEQRVFRELQEGLLEAELRRAANGTWPAVAALAADGIPPFAPDPTAKGGTYHWRLTQSEIFINYLGVPQELDGPAWLVLIEEPVPGALPYPGRPDEEHHRLADGTMLRVSTWVHPSGGRIASGIIRIPQAGGWTQLYAVGPSVE